MRKKPKYGYARDYFGRVVERDVFDEERGDENWSARKQQNNYDYSSFDSEDDHDSYYGEDSFD